ncbi:MAG: catalase family protein [Desulfobacterales bacterium]|nr:catalase family protein [Desulfobacterales bacterium]
MKKNRGMVLLVLALVGFACADVITGKEADFRSGHGTEGKQRGMLKVVDEFVQINKSDERYNVKITNGKLGDITKFENVPADEEQMIKDMESILQEKMSKDYPKGQTKRGAHPKNMACLQAEFIVEPNIPVELKVGIFELPQTYPAWIRISSASGKVQSDKVKDLRGFAIKIMGVQGERYKTQNEEKETQDFILISYPIMPLGTVKLFHDAVYYSIKWSPLVFLSRLVISGNFYVINELLKANQNQTSPLDIRYWSTTPYLYGTNLVVKYAIVPTSNMKSVLPSNLTDHYLTENMEKHLASNEASFDFMIQVQKDPDRMPVEDAGVEWSEKESPFIKVAALRIPPQIFRTREREELAEDLSFSPAHALIEHRPIGGINRARVELYRYLSEFRHKQNNKPLIEPGKQTDGGRHEQQ